MQCFDNCLDRMTKGMPRRRQRVLPGRVNLGEYFRIRQSVLLCYWLIPKSSSAGKSALAGNMPDSAQICRGRFTNSAPADAIVAALAGSECHHLGTASVQLPIWL
ncbi:hypothetical protein V6N11_071202 [Hibiscus sabdariffa]|uniref:Uncharacterized protein n=1 Tax=Hibiscus sabdariffa TaxID=183260 RepID=A0ABR2U036_9ROSI